MAGKPFTSFHFRRFQVRLRALLVRVGRWLPVWLGIAIVGAIALVYWQAGERSVTEISIATGSTGGSYHAFGQVIASALNEADAPITASVVASAGAKQNASLVATSARYIGLVQSNTQLSGEVKLIARLYPEVFHLLARPGVDINDVSDLVGKRVALMPKGSGSNTAFYQMLKHYKVPQNAMDISSGTLSDGLKALEDGAADALLS